MPNINNLICECSECKKQFNLDTVVLKERKIEIDKKKLELKIITCPFCFAEMTVQIDDSETKKILEKQYFANVKYAKKKFEGGKAKKQYHKCQELSQSLIQARKNLELKYNGSLYYFENGIKKVNINAPVVKITG